MRVEVPRDESLPKDPQKTLQGAFNNPLEILDQYNLVASFVEDHLINQLLGEQQAQTAGAQTLGFARLGVGKKRICDNPGRPGEFIAQQPGWQPHRLASQRIACFRPAARRSWAQGD